MKVIRSLVPAAPGEPGTVVTIGNFDGVHLGHQEILRRAVARAREQGLTPAVLSFDPHPARVLAPERAPRLITTTAQRLRRLEAAGVETVLLVPFSLDFARLTPAEFADQVLHRTLDARVVMVGEDFRFGHKQSGDLATLRDLGQQFGFTVEAIHDIHAGTRSGGLRISSTSIRTLVMQGKVSRACRLMGTPFALEGPVISGQGIGRTQTVPTLNLAAENELLPRNGVYITRTRTEPGDSPIASVTNVGNRPTFDGVGLSIETFLLTERPVETPTRIEVEFLSFIRDEKKFPTPEALKARIFRDVRSARRFHAKFGRTLTKSLVG